LTAEGETESAATWAAVIAGHDAIVIVIAIAIAIVVDLVLVLDLDLDLDRDLVLHQATGNWATPLRLP